MAIAPSKLGGLVLKTVGRVEGSDAAALFSALKQRGLLVEGVRVGDIVPLLAKVQAEPNYHDPFNSPEERLREHLRPFLSPKGLTWAEPLSSLDLPDEDGPLDHSNSERRPPRPSRWTMLIRRRRESERRADPEPPPQVEAAGPAPAKAVSFSTESDHQVPLQPLIFERPKQWFCTKCGEGPMPQHNDYLCTRCGTVRPFGGGSMTMRQCRSCAQFNLGLASYCEWCGQSTGAD